MSAPGRPKREFPPRGDDAKRQGGRMSAPGRPKREFPPGGTTRSVKGAA
jgi:hypothetical protein